MSAIKYFLTLGVIGWLVLGLGGCGDSDSDGGAERQENASASTATHSHTGDKETPGPNGGRVIKGVQPAFEFFVLENRHVQLTYLDDQMQPIPAVINARISLIGGDRMSPSSLSFVKSGDVLQSDKPLPPGDNYPVILTIEQSSEIIPVQEKFNIDFSVCGSCNLQEYACICGH